MKITILFNHCSRRSKIRGFLIILWHFNGVVVCTFIRIMEKLRHIFCALLLALNMSHMGDSRLYVPNWDRGLESCPVPSFDNVKVSKRFFKTSCCRSYLKKISQDQVEERRAVRDLQVQEQAEVRPDRGADDEPMSAWQVSAVCSGT